MASEKISGQSQTSVPVDATDGFAGCDTPAPHQSPPPGAQDLSLSVAGVEITRPNQVWSANITHIPMQWGFMYLVAILDWHSHYVLSGELPNTLDGDFCLLALERALQHGQPEIFNIDQGTQFTAMVFTTRLGQAGIKISMDGKGRAFDNIFIERLWCTLKYEHIYLTDYTTGLELVVGLANYFDFYNHDQFHQSLDYCTPAQIYGINQAILAQ